MTSAPLVLQPIVSWPRRARVGQRYLLTVDFDPVAGLGSWPYDREEVVLHCLLRTAPLFASEPIGEPAVVVHRFGGSYGPARFVLTASQQPREGSIQLALINDRGVDMSHIELDDVRVVAGESEEADVALRLPGAPESPPASWRRMLEQFHHVARGIEHPEEQGDYFTGRAQALRELVRWMREDEHGGLCIVTGAPGSGKSALLGRVVVLADRELRRGVDLARLPTDTVPPEGAVDAAVTAAGMTIEELADAVGLTPATGPRPMVVVVDDLDASSGPAAETARMLTRAMSEVKLLVSMRRGPLLQALGAARLVDLDSAGYFQEADLLEYSRRRLLRPADPAAATPYRDAPAHVERVAARVAVAAAPSFLVARQITSRLAQRTQAVDPDHPRWSREIDVLAAQARGEPAEVAPAQHARRVAVLHLEVDDDKLHWSLTSATDEPERRGFAPVEVTRARRESLDRLVDLLRSAADVDSPETLADESHRRFVTGAGQELFELLFSSEVRRELAATLGLLASGNLDGLRVSMEFSGRDEAWLAAQPWEYLHTPADDPDFGFGGAFLARYVGLVISRRLRRKARTLQAGHAPPLHVLLVASGAQRANHATLPSGGPEPIIEAMLQLADQGLLDLHTLVDRSGEDPEPDRERHVTWDGIHAAARELDPTVVHFRLHARLRKGRAELGAADRAGAVDWLSDDELVNLLTLTKSLRLVVMEAIESSLPNPYFAFAALAHQFAARGIPAVVALHQPRAPVDSAAFAALFYGAITAGSPVDVAVAETTERDDARSVSHPSLVYLSSQGALVSPRVADEHVTVRTRPDDSCTRCGTPKRRLDQNLCTRCGLRFRCPMCGRPYAEPLAQTYCANCGERVHQVPLEAEIKQGSGRPDMYHGDV